jgi:DDE superfamily endonuclease
VQNPETGEQKQLPRLTVKTPFKKPKGGELTEEQQVYNQTINKLRVRAEHCIGWVKNWAIIATRFRCAHAIYTPIMQVVCGLVNLQTERWQAAQRQSLG